MPDTIQAQQGTEQKLVFRTEEDRQKALDELPVEPPAGIQNLDDWRNELDAKQDALEAATIDPNWQEGQPPSPRTDPPAQEPGAPASAQPGSDWYRPEDWTFQQNGQTITIGRDEIPADLQGRNISNAKDLILDYVSTHRYAETKKQEHSQEVADLRAQLE